MDAQAEDTCADGNQRNRYRERTIAIAVGTINLRIPKLRRGAYFPGNLIVHLMRNAASCVPTRQKRAAAIAIPRALLAEHNPALARKLYYISWRTPKPAH